MTIVAYLKDVIIVECFIILRDPIQDNLIEQMDGFFMIYVY